ncbi:hypothetical protein PSCICE_09010 [Pseudomonas cichorii]|nr:hypothetical protein [Pseudomonas cichorii]GFM49634.1 hypothetical protein PSCICE_09010 [Pseudomonas cichorii]
MSQENSLSYLKQFSISIVTLVLGSFVFVGVIENYKSDESIKVSQLEAYFKPAREAANACLKKQNELFLHYPEYGGTFSLLFGEFNHLVENPELKHSIGYNIVLEGYAKQLFRVMKVQDSLPHEVVGCREDVFLKLEVLSIVTGSFDRFTNASSRRADMLNAIDRQLREKLKENTKNSDVDELMKMLRKFGDADVMSEEAMRGMVVDFSAKLPVIERYSEAMAKAEQEKYNVESEFFSVVRQESASRINSRFRQGFFSWLLR